jgi:hypothetical protein
MKVLLHKLVLLARAQKSNHWPKQVATEAIDVDYMTSRWVKQNLWDVPSKAERRSHQGHHSSNFTLDISMSVWIQIPNWCDRTRRRNRLQRVALSLRNPHPLPCRCLLPVERARRGWTTSAGQ